MAGIFKTSVLLTFFFGVNKIVALLRQALIVRQFGLSPEIDAFNVANNIPDLIFSLFSGGALALAFIPIFVEYIEEFGKSESWRLFSKVANFLFLITLTLCGIVYIFAKPLVSGEFGISPGFSPEQQEIVVHLMRINLSSILVFSLGGLVMASLQSHKHFLLPAIAPILYNIGMIVGIVVLVPRIGIYGLAYGTVLGAILHLGVQIPGIVHHKFRWHPVLDFKEQGFQKIIRLMVPRILTILLIQITFLARDNFASRLPTGSVSALTYGYFIMQVPETLIGTAVATALLPSLASFLSKKKFDEFLHLINTSIKALIAVTFGITIILSLVLKDLVGVFFNFTDTQTNLLVFTSWAFLFGLLAQCLLEILARAFYARQNARLPLVATFVRVILFLIVSFLTFGVYGAPAIAFADSVTVGVEVLILLYFLHDFKDLVSNFGNTLMRSIFGGVLSGSLLFLLLRVLPFPDIINLTAAISVSSIIYLIFIRKELQLLIRI